MHFSEAVANHRTNSNTVPQGVEFCRIVWRERIGGPFELFQYPRPRIALITNETQCDSERVRRAILANLNNVSEQGRGVEKDVLSKVSVHLGFGMVASGDAPKNLQHH